MVNSISGGGGAYVGKTGTLGDEYDVQSKRIKIMNNALGASGDFKSTLALNSVDTAAVLQKIENHVEGNDTSGDGTTGNLLNWNSYLASDDKPNDVLFESSNDKMFTNVNFDQGNYDIMDEKGFTTKLGMDWSNGKPYDVFKVNQNKIDFYDFTFGGTGDGDQANEVFDLSKFDNARWGLQNYTIREVDTSYWSTTPATTTGTTSSTADKQKALSLDSLNLIKQAMPQWMTDQISNELSQYKEGSTEYLTKFYQEAVKLMDQEGVYNGTYKAST